MRPQGQRRGSRVSPVPPEKAPCRRRLGKGVGGGGGGRGHKKGGKNPPYFGRFAETHREECLPSLFFSASPPLPSPRRGAGSLLLMGDPLDRSTGKGARRKPAKGWAPRLIDDRPVGEGGPRAPPKGRSVVTRERSGQFNSSNGHTLVEFVFEVAAKFGKVRACRWEGCKGEGQNMRKHPSLGNIFPSLFCSAAPSEKCPGSSFGPEVSRDGGFFAQHHTIITS